MANCECVDITLHTIMECIMHPFIHQTPFNELQPDALNGQVLKYAKTVYQLEKGLPPNAVVPKLKEKVEDMKEKVRI